TGVQTCALPILGGRGEVRERGAEGLVGAGRQRPDDGRGVREAVAHRARGPEHRTDVDRVASMSWSMDEDKEMDEMDTQDREKCPRCTHTVVTSAGGSASGNLAPN